MHIQRLHMLVIVGEIKCTYERCFLVRKLVTVAILQQNLPTGSFVSAAAGGVELFLVPVPGGGPEIFGVYRPTLNLQWTQRESMADLILSHWFHVNKNVEYCCFV